MVGVDELLDGAALHAAGGDAVRVAEALALHELGGATLHLRDGLAHDADVSGEAAVELLTEEHAGGGVAHRGAHEPRTDARWKARPSADVVVRCQALQTEQW